MKKEHGKKIGIISIVIGLTTIVGSAVALTINKLKNNKLTKPIGGGSATVNTGTAGGNKNIATTAGGGLKNNSTTGGTPLVYNFNNMPSSDSGFPLKWGSKGTYVKQLQSALVEQGQSLPGSTDDSGNFDGIFGSETQDALQAVTGKTTVDSLAQLNSIVAGNVYGANVAGLDFTKGNLN